MKKQSVREAAPELADWLNEIKEAFGIAAVKVVVDGVVIFEKGRLI